MPTQAQDGVKDKFGRFLLFWVVQGVWVMLISMPNLFINSSAANRPGRKPKAQYLRVQVSSHSSNMNFTVGFA